MKTVQCSRRYVSVEGGGGGREDLSTSNYNHADGSLTSENYLVNLNRSECSNLT